MIICFGSNFFGQLGLGKRRSRPSSCIASEFGVSDDFQLDPATVMDIGCGSQFSVVLSRQGDLLLSGTLNGILSPSLSPVEIAYPLKCTQIACGRKHILGLMEGGFVVSWGVGYFGQLGHGDDSSWDQPKIINALEPARLGSKIVSVVCGGSHSGAVSESGQVYMWGLNRNGQCGVGANTSGKLDSVSEPRPVDTSRLAGGRADTVVCGRNHSAMVTTEGRVFVWGAATFGRLGLAETSRSQPAPIELATFRNVPIHSIAAGDFHMLALGHDCAVYSWGYGAEGQTGHGNLLHLKTPQRIEFFDSLHVVSICCGSLWSMAVSRAGTLYGWGYGDGGWLGMPCARNAPYAEADSPGARNINSKIVQSFDSRLNVLLPQRVKAPMLSGAAVVERVRCGGAHTVIFTAAVPHNNSNSNSNSRETAAMGAAEADDKSSYLYGYEETVSDANMFEASARTSARQQQYAGSEEMERSPDPHLEAMASLSPSRYGHAHSQAMMGKGNFGNVSQRKSDRSMKDEDKSDDDNFSFKKYERENYTYRDLTYRDGSSQRAGGTSGREREEFHTSNSGAPAPQSMRSHSSEVGVWLDCMHVFKIRSKRHVLKYICLNAH
jgi:alpha-tubulin suppressor-like RCC1 family protein